MLNRGRLITYSLPAWTTQSTSGMFTLADVGALKAANTYPRGPIDPTGLSASVGNNQLGLSWNAPATTHGTITNYLVEYTASGGSPQYILTGSTSTSYTLTGLTNDVSYTIRVAAVNYTAGDFSSSVSQTLSAFTPMAVVLTTGSSYTVPAVASSMKAWAVGGGAQGSIFDGAGGAGGTAFKTWAVQGGNTISYSVGGKNTNTTVTFSGTTITGFGPSAYSMNGGGFSGGDGGANGGNGSWAGYKQPSYGGAVGGNGASACGGRRRVMTDVSGLIAALTLAGVNTSETCNSPTTVEGAFGSGGSEVKSLSDVFSGRGGGGFGGPGGAVVLYFT